MKRKIPFLYPALLLISTLCFFVMACFSGYQEKGEVTISFSESTINQILARGAVVSEEQEGDNDFDISSFDFLDVNNKLKAQSIVTAKGVYDSFVLYVFNDYTYAVYSSRLMSDLDLSYYSDFSNITDHSTLISNPKYYEMISNPYEILEPAIVSKGTWVQNVSSIDITETDYKTESSTDFITVPENDQSVIATIPQDAQSFVAESHAGFSITFYYSNGQSDIIIPKDETEVYPKLQVRVTAGNIIYEKTLPVKTGIKKASVTFNDLPVGLSAKASAIVYYMDDDESWQIFAKGESPEFVIKAGNNKANIILKKTNSSKDIDDSNDFPFYSGKTTLNQEYWQYFNGGWLYFNTNPDGTYSIYCNVYTDDSSDSYNKIFAQGNCELIENDDEGILKLTESDYYDFDSDELVSGVGKVTQIDLSKSSFTYNTSASLQLEFDLNIAKEDYPFTFMISGYEENDFIDLGDNVCTVYLYEIKDASVMSSLKSTLSSEELTDAKKAEVLIPVIENCLNYTLTVFQPGVSYSTHAGGPTNQVLDDGTIEWSGSCQTSIRSGKTYGVLATVYFSQTQDTGFYEFAVGLADNLTLSEKSNEIELTVEVMDIPCNINFHYDNNYDPDYTVKTALSDIVLLDESENLRESVLNEILSAAQESITALEKRGYKYNENINPDYNIQDGVPFVTLYYIYDDSTNTVVIQEGE